MMRTGLKRNEAKGLNIYRHIFMEVGGRILSAMKKYLRGSKVDGFEKYQVSNVGFRFFFLSIITDFK